MSHMQIHLPSCISSPPPCKTPPPPPRIFCAKFCWGIFIPRISPPLPRRRLIPQLKYSFYLPKPPGCLPLKCLLQMWTAFINVGASLCLAPGNASCLAPTDNEVMLYRYRKGGRNRERKLVASHIYISPPPAFCIEAKVAKGLRDTTVHVALIATTRGHVCH